MNTNSHGQRLSREGSPAVSAEQRLKELPSRLVYGVASLPLGTPIELEVIFEVAG